MALRIFVDLGDRVARFALKEGSHVIGSEAGCDLAIRHPTVSRKHARLTIGTSGNVLEDTGSSNGTWINGERLSGPSPLKPGDTLRLGSVVARVEAVDLADIEAGIRIPYDETWDDSENPVRTGGRTTIGPAVLESFSLKRLPEIARILASGGSKIEVAQAVGNAVFSGLPCNKVEIGRLRAGLDGLLFCARHQGQETGFEEQSDVGDGDFIRVRFLTEALATRYAPLVELSASLIRSAGRRETESTFPSGPEQPAPAAPKPRSLVPEVIEIYSRAGRIAQSPVSVLIQGESGTGKELLARYIHAASDRAEAPLVTLNCAALPRDLLESELFGVERGAATGVRARPGRFETADGGTLFLDEIGDMAPETQARILRVLQEKEVYRVGGTRALSADVRVISATNRDLDTMLTQGSFRRDLYHRIADWVVELPPLRERKADIPNLAVHFLSRACRKRGVRPKGISRAALEILRNYDWPGNVRQLEKEMGRAALFVENDGMLDSSCLQQAIRGGASPSRSDALKEVLKRTELEHIGRILKECGGNVEGASERLEMGISTLYRRMKILGIQSEDPDD